MKRFFRRIGGWLQCVFGLHDWTCSADQGVKPTKEQLDGGVKGFWDYAKMYCGRCGEVSELSKKRMEDE